MRTVLNSCRFSVPPHLVKEHRFAHAAQTYQHHALRRPAQAKPIKAYADILPDDASPGEFGWRAAGARCIGISNRIHM